jgi:GNAT superfamily N-acetyltransferase
MRIYKISTKEKEDTTAGNVLLQELIRKIKAEYEGIDVWAYETDNKIHLSSLKVPLEKRHQGIGKKVVNMIKEFAKTRGKPITLDPEPERGYKNKLDVFYKDLGFKDNTGRNKDYSISSPFSRTMYWRPN